jgi:hypothetical protein
MDQTTETNGAEVQAVQTPASDLPQPSVKFTYPDGCEVYGVPPFPEMSPNERQAKILRDESADLIAQQQAGALKAAREAEAAKIVAANAQPAGIVTAADVQQTPDPLPDTPAAA